mmetsp:Transcript_29632/g.60825  ORF Transcript_29632/g.60825 Transcript_29632/m.60825 type:complete len:201 (+) Transcript_29632:1362-1964(+)
MIVSFTPSRKNEQSGSSSTNGTPVLVTVEMAILTARAGREDPWAPRTFATSDNHSSTSSSCPWSTPQSLQVGAFPVPSRRMGLRGVCPPPRVEGRGCCFCCCPPLPGGAVEASFASSSLIFLSLALRAFFTRFPVDEPPPIEQLLQSSSSPSEFHLCNNRAHSRVPSAKPVLEPRRRSCASRFVGLQSSPSGIASMSGQK